MSKLEWRPTGGIGAQVRRGDRKLMILAQSIAGAEWGLFAIETADDAVSTEEVFDDHAHAGLAEDVTLEVAMLLAQTYADAWVANDAEALEKCRCAGIEATTAARTLRPDPHAYDPGEDEPSEGVTGQPYTPDPFACLDRIGQPVQYCRCGKVYVGLPCHPGPLHDAGCDMGEDCVCGALVSSDPFHQHLEVCAQCREHPFKLCSKGLSIMQASA